MGPGGSSHVAVIATHIPLFNDLSDLVTTEEQVTGHPSPSVTVIVSISESGFWNIDLPRTLLRKRQTYFLSKLDLSSYQSHHSINLLHLFLNSIEKFSLMTHFLLRLPRPLLKEERKPLSLLLRTQPTNHTSTSAGSQLSYSC